MKFSIIARETQKILLLSIYRIILPPNIKHYVRVCKMREYFKMKASSVAGRDQMPIHSGDECLIHYPSNREIHNKHGIATIINDGEAPIRMLVTFDKGGSTLLTPNDVSLVRTAQEVAAAPKALEIPVKAGIPFLPNGRAAFTKAFE